MGSSQACASCKYQRRKCTKDCLLAPYFPYDKPSIFRNARRLFGVSNMQKLLKMVEPSRRDKAMETMIYEANMRAADPVYGCASLARQYHSKIVFLTEELQFVRMQIAQFKQQQYHNTYDDKELSQQQNQNYEGSGVRESPTNLHRNQVDFANIMEDYNFDAIPGKCDYWRLGHGQLNFEATDMDDFFAGSSVIALDGHHQHSPENLPCQALPWIKKEKPKP